MRGIQRRGRSKRNINKGRSKKHINKGKADLVAVAHRRRGVQMAVWLAIGVRRAAINSCN